MCGISRNYKKKLAIMLSAPMQKCKALHIDTFFWMHPKYLVNISELILRKNSPKKIFFLAFSCSKKILQSVCWKKKKIVERQKIAKTLKQNYR